VMKAIFLLLLFVAISAQAYELVKTRVRSQFFDPGLLSRFGVRARYGVRGHHDGQPAHCGGRTAGTGRQITRDLPGNAEQDSAGRHRGCGDCDYSRESGPFLHVIHELRS